MQANSTVTEEENVKPPSRANEILLFNINQKSLPGLPSVTSLKTKKEVEKEIKKSQDNIDILDNWFLHYAEAGRMRVNENDTASKWLFPNSTEEMNKLDSDDEGKDQGASSADCHTPKEKHSSFMTLLLSMLVDIPKAMACQKGTDSWHGRTKVAAGPQGVGFYRPSHKSTSFASPTLMLDKIGAVMGFCTNAESSGRNYSPPPPPCFQPPLHPSTP